MVINTKVELNDYLSMAELTKFIDSLYENLFISEKVS